MRLIGVIWDEDRGVVDLETGKIIMYAFSNTILAHFLIPTVTIRDEDFEPMVPEECRNRFSSLYDESLYNAANWNNVPALLALPEFDLESKLTQLEYL